MKRKDNEGEQEEGGEEGGRENTEKDERRVTEILSREREGLTMTVSK